MTHRLPRQVFVLLHRSGPEVLLLRRTLDGLWQGVTGAPEPGESDLEGAVREVREETGFDVGGTIEPLGFAYSFPVPDAFARLYAPGVEIIDEATFAAAVPPGRDPVISREHDDFRWCSLAAAEERLFWPENRRALQVLAARLSQTS
ncbi:MAG: NUDIX pyrophosphatase [Thermoleophilia bacterium]|nr:NUDIX pyrophosphatase [Thermoleophilia bacterium]